MKIHFKQKPPPKYGLSVASEYPLLSQKEVKNTTAFYNNIFTRNNIFSTY